MGTTVNGDVFQVSKILSLEAGGTDSLGLR